MSTGPSWAIASTTFARRRRPRNRDHMRAESPAPWLKSGLTRSVPETRAADNRAPDGCGWCRRCHCRRARSSASRHTGWRSQVPGPSSGCRHRRQTRSHALGRLEPAATPAGTPKPMAPAMAPSRRLSWRHPPMAMHPGRDIAGIGGDDRIFRRLLGDCRDHFAEVDAVSRAAAIGISKTR